LTSRIVRLKAVGEEKQTDNGRLFHTLTTRSTKKLLPTLQLDLNDDNDDTHHNILQ